MTESIPEPLAAHVWARRQSGESCEAISIWLAQIGYTVSLDEVSIIAFYYEQREPRLTRDDERGLDVPTIRGVVNPLDRRVTRSRFACGQLHRAQGAVVTASGARARAEQIESGDAPSTTPPDEDDYDQPCDGDQH